MRLWRQIINLSSLGYDDDDDDNYYDFDDDEDYIKHNSVFSRLVLCKTFKLEEDGKVLSPEELLYR